MKVTVLGEIHPEAGIAFIMEETDNLQALRLALSEIDKQIAGRILEKRLNLIKAVINEFIRQTNADTAAMKQERPDIYLVEGVQKTSLVYVLRSAGGAASRADAGIRKEANEFAKLCVEQCKQYVDKHEPFEYMLPRQIVTMLDFLPDKTIKLAGILSRSEALEMRLARIYAKYSPIGNKIRELPAAANMLHKLRKQEKERTMVITGLTHAQLYTSMLKLAGYDACMMQCISEKESVKMINMMKKADELFETSKIAADLEKEGIAPKEAKRAAAGFRYHRNQIELENE